MAYQNLSQVKSAVRNLSPRERVALREYLEEFKDFEDLNAVVSELRTNSPTADWEEIVTSVDIAVAETRNAKAKNRIRHQRLRQRPHR